MEFLAVPVMAKPYFCYYYLLAHRQSGFVALRATANVVTPILISLKFRQFTKFWFKFGGKFSADRFCGTLSPGQLARS